MRATYFNLPNMLSLSRVVVAFFLLLLPKKLSAFSVMCVVGGAVLTDLLDGYLARYLRCQSTFGAQLDPLCDAIFVLALVYHVLGHEGMSLRYWWLLLLRYVTIFFYHYELYRLYRVQLSSLWTGKCSSAMSMCGLWMYFSRQAAWWVPALDVLYFLVVALAVIFSVVSWYFYFCRYKTLMQSMLQRVGTESTPFSSGSHA